jgi:C-terminal processing protease CtpA/Prc
MKVKHFNLSYPAKIFYAVVIFCIIPNYISAQKYIVTTKRTEVVNLKYSLNDCNNYKKYTGFYFPEYEITDSAVSQAIKPFVKVKKNIPDFIKSKYLWDIQLKRTIDCHLDSTIFYFRYFITNVKTIDIYIHSITDNEWYIYKTNPEFQNYQIPIQVDFSKWTSCNNPGKKSFLSDSVYLKNIDRIVFTIDLINPKAKYDFCVANFKIFNIKEVNIEINHPFFDEFSGKKNSLADIDYNSYCKEPGQPFLLSPFFFYTIIPIQSNKFDILNPSSQNRIQMTSDVFYHILDKYPFYSERNIDKQKTMKRLKSYFSNFSTYEMIEDSIKSLIDEFQDPHFYVHAGNKIKEKEANLVDGPVRIIEINNEFYIASVFDTLLIKEIQPGMNVLKIDNVYTNSLIDSLSNNYKGTSCVRRIKATSRVLKRLREDSCILTLSNLKRDTFLVKIYYNRKNIIPNGFIVKQGTLRILEPNTAYYKLNHCINGTYIQFLNNYYIFKNQKNLIIDLRNAPGGEENEIINIASCFITEPRVYNNYIYNIRDSYDLKETTILQPNKLLNLANLNIYILINERTACAFEGFVNFMKLNTNTTIIGTSKTSGSYIATYELHFPWGLICSFNNLGKPILPGIGNIENKGIEPDIWVSLNKVDELAPYNDKVLQTALRIISKKNAIHNKKTQLIKW